MELSGSELVTANLKINGKLVTGFIGMWNLRCDEFTVFESENGGGGNFTTEIPEVYQMTWFQLHLVGKEITIRKTLKFLCRHKDMLISILMYKKKNTAK